MMAEAAGSSQTPADSHEVEGEEEEEFLPGFATLQDYSKALLTQVMQATRSANSLPSEGDDFDYYSSFPGFKTFSSKMGARINKSIGRLMRHQNLPCYWPPVGGGGGGGGERVQELDLEERIEALVEANDILLERVGGMLDDASGVSRNKEPVLPTTVQQGTAEVASWNKKKGSVHEAVSSFKFIHAKNLERPQMKFRDRIDNSNTPFIPLIREKPNALRPLPEVFQRLQNPISLNALIANAREWASCKERFEHAYQYELDHFEPTEEQLQLKEPQPAGGLEEVPLTIIDSLEQLQELQRTLTSVGEFAVDLEHHSYRSFLGFVCLMQISTRDHDYLIDTLELRQHMHILLDSFTNPRIVKVLHGADWDVQWLQRDFGLYLVNLFDTHQASRMLNLPRNSLAFLLQYCCNIHADKQYQLADWRIRPLPPEMIKYAREDTHYLLYIYDRMRNELIRRGNKQNNLLLSVLDQSRDVCLKQYRKPLFTEDAYLKLYHKHKRTFNPQQLQCLKFLYAWRDRVAREEDESTGYVLPNHMVFKISEILPREPQGLLACCNPIPTLLRQQLQEVHSLVQQARDSNTLPPMASPLQGIATPPAASTPVATPTHHTPLDTPTHSEEYDGSVSMATVIQTTGPPVQAAKPTLSAFETTTSTLTQAIKKKLEEIRHSFPDIFSKFLEAKPMTASEAILRQRLSETPGRRGLSTSATNTPGTPGSVSDSPLLLSTETPPTSVDTHPNASQSEPRREGVNVEIGEGAAVEKTGSVGKGKRTFSVREMGAGGGKDKKRPSEGEGAGVKRPRLGTTEKFKPFDYEHARFTEFTKELPRPVQVYNPYSQERQKGSNRDRQKLVGEHYTPNRYMSKRQSWPKTNK